jgi:hypothetical protein
MQFADVHEGCPSAHPTGGWKGAIPHPGEALGVREGPISLPDWDVLSGYTEGISLGRYRRATAPRELGATAQVGRGWNPILALYSSFSHPH